MANARGDEDADLSSLLSSSKKALKEETAKVEDDCLVFARPVAPVVTSPIQAQQAPKAKPSPASKPEGSKQQEPKPSQVEDLGMIMDDILLLNAPSLPPIPSVIADGSTIYKAPPSSQSDCYNKKRRVDPETPAKLQQPQQSQSSSSSMRTPPVMQRRVSNPFG